MTYNSWVVGCLSLSLNFIVWRINLYISCVSYHIIFISFSFSFLFPLLGRGSLKFKIYLGTFDTQKWSLTLFWGLIIVLNIFCRFFFLNFMMVKICHWKLLWIFSCYCMETFFLLGKKEKSRDFFCYTSKIRKAMVECSPPQTLLFQL